MASFAKSLSEYKVGNYETSIVLSWFVAEGGINLIWGKHIMELNADLPGGEKRINRGRRDFLTGRDFTVSIISNLLELWGLLPNEIFRDIDAVRGFRNKIVHGHSFQLGAEECQLALQIAQWMIAKEWDIDFTPNMGYSVSGL